MKYKLGLTLILFAIWLLWSGHFTAFLITLGALSCIAVVALVSRMGLVDREGVPLQLSVRPQLYAPWLAWEIVKSNLDVARRILSPGLPISPRMIRVKAGQKTDIGRVIYANSITLTPGTVSVGLDGDVITVHALTREAAEGVLGGEMDRRVRSIEGSD